MAISPFLEHRIASRWAGYEWSDYVELPGDPCFVDGIVFTDCKAMVLISYRIAKDIEAITNAWD